MSTVKFTEKCYAALRRLTSLACLPLHHGHSGQPTGGVGLVRVTAGLGRDRNDTSHLKE